jgi:sec-independent protein translocase protein TatA
MPKLGALEIILILVIILIVFGVGKLPQVGGAIGKSIREFHKARDGEDEKGKDVAKSTEKETKETKSS